MFSLNLNEAKAVKKKEEVLYVIKIDPYEDAMNIKVKLRSIEMWITDFEYEVEAKTEGNLQDGQKAQILKLEFQTDFFMDQETLSRYITSSKKMPPKNIMNNSAHKYMDRVNQ